MGHSGPRPVKPCLLVKVARGNKGRSSNLLGIQAKANGPRAVLALGDGPRYSFGFKAVVEARLILIRVVGACCKGRDGPILLR